MLCLRLAFLSAAPFALFILIPPEVGAQTCGTRVCTESEGCLAGDGVIASAGFCIYFSGSFPIYDSSIENLGGFPVGTPVHIEGCATPYLGICSLAWAIRDNTIESLVPNVPALGRPGIVLVVLSMLGIGCFGVWRFQNQHPR